MRDKIPVDSAHDQSREDVREQRTRDYSDDPAQFLIESLVRGVGQATRDPELIDQRNEDDRNDRADFCEQAIAEGGEPSVTACRSGGRAQVT